MKLRSSLFPAFVFGLLGAACSSDSDSEGGSGGEAAGGAGALTGLPVGTRLRDLTEDEAQRACADTLSKVDHDDIDRAFCARAEFYGLRKSVAECEILVDECLAERGPVKDLCANAAAKFVNCEATIGEYEACAVLSERKDRDLIAKFTCEWVAADIGPDDFDFGGPACTTFETKCPNHTGGF